MLFQPTNVERQDDKTLRLQCRSEDVGVRVYTSGAIASEDRFRYGQLRVRLKAAGTAGLITGVFLHRNAPRQEIDIEIPGNNPRQMLTNVYYNPGIEGAKLEYGFRGTPVVVDLGVDVSKDFYTFEIDWQPGRIAWHVDGRKVHERFDWDPTPIPDCPLEVNVNLWSSRSKRLAGDLAASSLPASAFVETVEVATHERTDQDA